MLKADRKHDWKQLVEEAEAQGFRVKEFADGHALFTSPTGGTMRTRSTGNVGRAWKRQISRLRRLGFTWPPPHQHDTRPSVSVSPATYPSVAHANNEAGVRVDEWHYIPDDERTEPASPPQTPEPEVEAAMLQPVPSETPPATGRKSPANYRADILRVLNERPGLSPWAMSTILGIPANPLRQMMTVMRTVEGTLETRKKGEYFVTEKGRRMMQSAPAAATAPELERVGTLPHSGGLHYAMGNREGDVNISRELVARAVGLAKQNNVTQHRLCRLIGVDVSTLSKWVTGAKTVTRATGSLPAYRKLEAMVEAHDTGTLQWFIDNTGENSYRIREGTVPDPATPEPAPEPAYAGETVEEAPEPTPPVSDTAAVTEAATAKATASKASNVSTIAEFFEEEIERRVSDHRARADRLERENSELRHENADLKSQARSGEMRKEARYAKAVEVATKAFWEELQKDG